MTAPTPLTHPGYFQYVRLGGFLIREAILVEINGVSVEDEWNEQKPTGSSGATNVFKGTKPPGPVTLTFEAVDDAGYQEMDTVLDMLAPRPGFGGNGTGNTTGSPGSAAAQYVNATGSAGGSTTGTTPAAASSATPTGTIPGVTASGGTTTTATPNPGPKPPTLSIRNGYVNRMGITSVSRKKVEIKPTETNSTRYTIELVNQKDPVPAAVGAAAPKTPDNPGQQYAGAGGGGTPAADPASSAKDANAAAAQAGAQ